MGRFLSLYQFCEKVDLGAINRRMIESLIRAGAMDSLEGTRSQKFAAVEERHGRRAARLARPRERPGGAVRRMPWPGKRTSRRRCPTCPIGPTKRSWPARKRCWASGSPGHPLDRYADKIAELATHDSGNLEGLAKDAEVALCGVLTGIPRKRNREGKPWAAMTIEDRNGSVEALVFAASFERLAPQIVEDKAVLVRGLALPEESGPPKISVQEIVPLDNARVDLPSVISIRVWLGRNGKRGQARQALEELFRRKPGETQVRLRLETPRDFSVLLDVPAKVRPDREFRTVVEEICGAEAIERVAG